MADFNTIKNTLYDWAIAVNSGITVVWNNQQTSKRDNPLFVFGISGFTQIGHEYVGSPSNNGIADVLFHNDFTLTILGFGKDIIENTIKLRQSLGRPSIQATLDAGGVIIVNPLPVLDITTITNDAQYEERSSCDIILRTETSYANEDVGIIKDVKGTGNLKNPGKADYQSTLNIKTTP